MSDIQGTCAGCGRGIPHGFLAMVTKWESKEWGKTMRVNMPTEIWCRQCPGSRDLMQHQVTHRTRTEQPVAEDLSAKELALRLFRAVTAKPRNAKKLAARAQVAYTELVPVILQKLTEAGKIKWIKGFDGVGKWVTI